MYRAWALGGRAGRRAVSLNSRRPESSSSKAKEQSTSTSASTSGAGADGGGGGGGGGKLLLSLGLAGALAGGVTTYAAYDEEFRSRVESFVPGSESVFASILGPVKAAKPVETEVKSLMPKSKPAYDPPPEILPKVKSAKELAEEEGRRKDEETRKAAAAKEAALKSLEAELEKKVKAVIGAGEEATKAAIAAKTELTNAIKEHCKRLRTALEAKEEGDWSIVSEALKTKEALESSAAEVEAKARAELAKVTKVIEEARKAKDTKDSPILINAKETLKQLEYRIADAAAGVKEAAIESKIVAEFRDLVEKGREEFARELRSILPNIDPREKSPKLTEDELNALIAHAHLRVDELRRQLREQEVRESGNLEKARQRQAEEDRRAFEEKLERELALLTSGSDAAWERKLAEERERFEEELRAQLRRATAAHSEHLEEVLTQQRRLAAEDKVAAVRDALMEERHLFHSEIAASLARLEGIESALEGRAALDAENRRSKELWLACQKLLDSVEVGQRAAKDMEQRRQPLAQQLAAIRQASPQDAFVTTLAGSVSGEALEKGVYTHHDLKERFHKVRRLGRRVAGIGEDGASLWIYAISALRALLSLDFWKVYSKEELVDPATLDTYGLFSRARYFLRQDDLETAVKYLNLLEGEPKSVASSWIQDVRRHLETRQAAQLLLAHAAALSIHSIY